MTSLSGLCVAIILGLCSASIQPPRNITPCPAPCLCLDSTISCRGCPTSYITISPNTKILHIKSCKDIQYLLRLHQRPDNSNLSTLEIRDSYIAQPESFIYDFDIQALILSNDSIVKVNPGGKVSNLTFLDLSHNAMEIINDRTFEGMGRLLHLDLSANRIMGMENECFHGLGKLLQLNLSSNNLTRLNDTVFSPLVSLQSLNLSVNGLEMLSEKSFSNLLMLQQLDVSYNKLKSIAPGTLQFLPNLAKLIMGDNPRLKPDAQIFVGTGRRLQQVDASRTGLSQVPEALTHSVRYLTLSGNQIALVTCGDLDSYPLLNMLDFTDNILTEIEDDALGRLEMLSQLYLNRNRLKTVPKMLPDKLKYLSLDSNFVSNLTTLDFASLSCLKVLIISNNLINYVQENAFITLVSLEVLDLSNNPLKILTPNTFSGPVSLKDLRMAYLNISPPAKDISFPVPSPEGIENLHLEYSPGLTRQLMADTAALAAMTRLQYLDIRFSNITVLRSDLLHFLPELKTLKLEGNRLNCSDIAWLADWMNENPESDEKHLKCYSPAYQSGKPIVSFKTNKPTIETNEAYIPKSAGLVLQKKNGNSSTTAAEFSATKIDSKLLQIFSERSQGSSNHRYDTKTYPTTAAPCSGNSNGPENKTKCSQHPVEGASVPPEDGRNTNIARFMYRKIGGDITSTEEYEDNAEKYNSTILEVVRENASEYQTSRYRAEASIGTGNFGVLAAAMVATAAGAALATAWAARRRPRPRQDLMEVPTIAAVGELW